MNEQIVVRGTPRVLEANGAAITNNAIGQADDATYDTTTHGGGFPHIEFVASMTFTVAPLVNSVIEVVARALDIDGTNDAPVPTATYRNRKVGFLVVKDVTTLQTLTCLCERVPKLAEYYLYNNATGQTIPATWTATVTPLTYKPAP